MPRTSFICKFNYQAQGIKTTKTVSVDRAAWSAFFFLFLVKTEVTGTIDSGIFLFAASPGL